MKYMSTIAICKGFALCRGFMTANDKFNYDPADSNTDTRYTQITYLDPGVGSFYRNSDFICGFDGSNLTVSDNYKDWFDKNVQLGDNNSALINIEEFKGTFCSFSTTDSVGIQWTCINPIPANKPFSPTLLKQNTNLSIQGDGKEHVIVSVRGSITINNKTINQYNYARVLGGKTADVVIPSGSEAVYLTR